MKTTILSLAFVAIMAMSAAAARAATITVFTPTGSAEADLTTGAGTVTLTLKNLTSNPEGVAQCLSAFWFTLSDPIGASSLTYSSGVERTVNSNHTYTTGNSVASGWAFSASGSTLKIDVLAPGGVGPEHTIIGAPGKTNKYSSAGGSIAGNGPHNPFLGEAATFNFKVAGATSSTYVTMATFQFGTTDGSGLIAGSTPVFAGVGAPLPAALWAGLSLLMCLGAAKAIRRRTE